jgi:hypothetical protein
MAKDKSPGRFKFPFKLHTLKTGEEVPQAQGVPKVVSPLKLVFFIVDWSKSQVISDVFDEEKVRFHLSPGAGELPAPKCLTSWA